MVAGVLIIAKRWQIILETIGYNFQYKECFNLIMAAFPLTSITPSKSGDVIKAYYLKDKIPASKTAGSVINRKDIDLMFSCLFLPSCSNHNIYIPAKQIHKNLYRLRKNEIGNKRTY
jgi:uncharacterized protein (TIRG00374 family)